MTFKLYRTPIPEDALLEGTASARAELAKLGLLAGGSVVNAVSGQPGEISVRNQTRGLYADRVQLELKELLESQFLQNLPFTRKDTDSNLDGYYAVELVQNVGQGIRPGLSGIEQADATLVREGTRASHRKAVRTRVNQPDPGNTFGNDTTALIGVPADASRVQWIDDVPASQTESPAVVSTVTAHHGGTPDSVDIDLVDARAPSFDDPILVYDLPYADQGYPDPGVWDTYGTSSITDGNGVVQWGRVFDPAHDPRSNHELVVENGLLRLTFDDDTNTLTAEEWNDGTSSWDSVTLGTSDWELLETDIRVINGMRVDAYVTFRDSTSPSTEYSLRMVLPRGYENALWLVPDGVTASVPSGLSTLLDPIADSQVYRAHPEFGLVAREDL